MRFALLALVAALASCASSRHATCTRQVNQCLDACPPENRSVERDRNFTNVPMRQDPCQQRCQEIGQSCERAEQEAARRAAAEAEAPGK